MKNSTKLNTVIEAIITVIATPTIITLGAIIIQSLVAPKHFVTTPSSQILTQRHKPAVWNKYELLIAESTTNEPVQIIIFLLAAIGLLKLTEGISDRTYLRLFTFVVNTLERHKS
ncbi:MAG: hypothetical protein AAF063_13040 [Cyanobacteria bacterium J06643_5]